MDYAQDLLEGGGSRPQEQKEHDWAEDLLNPKPVGGTFGRREKPPAGYPTPAPPFPQVPGAYQEYIKPTEEPAGFGTLMQAGTVDDPLTKARIFAKARGIPEDQIGQRYRIGEGGAIEFKTEKGQWQREVPESLGGKLKETGAAILSHPSTYMGTIGAAGAGIPGAVGGAVAGALTRQTYGRVVHDEPQTLSGNVMDVVTEGLLALGGEAVGKVLAGGWNMFRTSAAPRILKRAGREIYEGALSAQDHARAAMLKQLAKKHDIDLLPHQLYNKESMTKMWIYLRNHPLTADAIQKFDQTLEEQTQQAVENFARRMGGYDYGAQEMGGRLRNASENAIETAENARINTAKPYYDAALEPREVVDIGKLYEEVRGNKRIIESMVPKETPDKAAMVNELNKGRIPAMRQVNESEKAHLGRITRDYKRVFGKEPPTIKTPVDEEAIGTLNRRNEEVGKIIEGGQVPEGAYVPKKPFTVDVSEAEKEVDRLMSETVKGDPSYTALRQIKKMLTEAGGDPQKLDRVKRSGIDNVLNKSKVPTLRREMKLVKDKLVEAMDKQIPDYNAARGIYGEYGMAKPIEDLKRSVVGQLSNLEKDKDLVKAVTMIFGPEQQIDEKLMLRARDAIRKQDPEIWDKAVGNYIRTLYEKMTTSQGGGVINNAGKMYKELFGNPPRRRAMAAAFGGENTPEFKTFEGLMEVLQNAARGKSAQSITHFAGEIKESMIPERGLQKFLKHPYEYAVDRTFQWWNDMLLHGRQDKLLQALSDPQIQAKIAQIRPITKTQRRSIEAFTTATALIATKIEALRQKDER